MQHRLLTYRGHEPDPTVMVPSGEYRSRSPQSNIGFNSFPVSPMQTRKDFKTLAYRTLPKYKCSADSKTHQLPARSLHTNTLNTKHYSTLCLESDRAPVTRTISSPTFHSSCRYLYTYWHLFYFLIKLCPSSYLLQIFPIFVQ